MFNIPEKGKDISGCAIVGMMSVEGRMASGRKVISAIANMHERSNGLGGGFAAYGIYPEFSSQYALHIMFETPLAQRQTRDYLDANALVRHDEPIPTRPLEVIKNRPILHRYFIDIREDVRRQYYDLSEDDIIVKLVMEINRTMGGAFVFSSGRNMGVFKGVGYPEDIGEFYRLDEYEAYIWTAHGRFPTNTTGWWGGAHPFGLLDWSVVHNGEISSYGINRRYLGNYGYECLLHTDTEVIAYMFDLLVRKHKMPLELACVAMAPPFYQKIEKMAPDDAAVVKAIRMVYGGALLNGPFSVAVATRKMMMGFNDRIKLRPMWVASKDDMRYIASEEAAIRVIEPNPDRVWMARGGEPVIFTLENAEVVHA